jgi:hypothetical protein
VSEYSKPVRLAAAAYHAALAGQWQKAGRAVERISDECSGEGIMTALMAWCDWYADHATDGNAGKARPRMKFINAKTGELDDERSDRIPEHVRWAGQIIAARAALDEPKFMALINAMPEDGAQVGRYVMGVLECVATTVNGLPRGFAGMGRGAS